MSDELHELVGAYALGAIDEADAAAFEVHLETCADCQNELFGLTDTVLGLADLEDQLSVAAPEPRAVVEPELAPVEDLDSRRNGRWLAAAAAVAGLVFGLWTSGVFSEDRVELIASATDTEVIRLEGEAGTVDVLLSNTEAGVALDDANLTPLEEPELYVLWVIRHDGEAPEFVGNITDWTDVDKAWDLAVENVDIVAISVEQAPSPTTPSDEIVYVGERTRD
jgi:hypothetical protein